MKKNKFTAITISRLLIILLAISTLYYSNRYHTVQSVLGEFDTATVPLQSVQQIYPRAAAVEHSELPQEASVIRDEEGEVLGYVLDSRPYSDSFHGYAGPVPLLIIFDAQDIVEGIVLLENNETSSFINRLKDQGFLENWEGVKLKNIPEMEVDAVSRATMSCNAIENGVRKRVSVYLDYAYDDSPTPASPLAFLVLVPLLLVVASVVRPRMFLKYRFVIQLITVVILGFVTANMFSMAFFRGWIYNGINLNTQWPLVLMAVTVLFFLLFRKQNIYCAHLCPYGLLQILVLKLPVKKIRMPSKISALMPVIRGLVLFGVFVLMLTYNPDPSAVEPFAAFRIFEAPVSAVVIAVVFLIVAVFIPRLWCRMFCPTGKCIDMLKAKQSTETKR
ncbi:4Fe-4S binding protein [Chitinispirillales bacterium ANBcel5]|uniref:4Fe-4S binding protein n=1 Tax=Cellulosispirillum alkaliphilum TaxID=3039283 RepID=UPI002A547BA4|nr:4Fe-4S binding protein [Chitinispirillales bacterium ANBcel5]